MFHTYVESNKRTEPTSNIETRLTDREHADSSGGGGFGGGGEEIEQKRKKKRTHEQGQQCAACRGR